MARYQVILAFLVLLLNVGSSEATSAPEYLGSFRQGSTVPVVLVVSSAPTTATLTVRAADGTSLATGTMTRIGTTTAYQAEYLATCDPGIVLVEMADGGSGTSVFTYLHVVRPGGSTATRADVTQEANRLLRTLPKGGNQK